jgi:hypothetical protein
MGVQPAVRLVAFVPIFAVPHPVRGETGARHARGNLNCRPERRALSQKALCKSLHRAPVAAPTAPPLRTRCCWGVIWAHPVVADNSRMNATSDTRFTGTSLIRSLSAPNRVLLERITMAKEASEGSAGWRIVASECKVCGGAASDKEGISRQFRPLEPGS